MDMGQGAGVKQIDLGRRAVRRPQKGKVLTLHRGGFVQSFGKPNFDDRLPGDTKTFGFFVQGLNHP